MTKLEYLELYETVTNQLLAVDLNQPSNELIEKIESLLSERDTIIEKVDALGDENSINETVMNRICQKDNQLETLLQEIMLSIKDNIFDVVKEKSLSSTKKKANRSYANVGHQVDGYFIDKKK